MIIHLHVLLVFIGNSLKLSLSPLLHFLGFSLFALNLIPVLLHLIHPLLVLFLNCNSGYLFLSMVSLHHLSFVVLSLLSISLIWTLHIKYGLNGWQLCLCHHLLIYVLLVEVSRFFELALSLLFDSVKPFTLSLHRRFCTRQCSIILASSDISFWWRYTAWWVCWSICCSRISL